MWQSRIRLLENVYKHICIQKVLSTRAKKAIFAFKEIRASFCKTYAFCITLEFYSNCSKPDE
ncbi:hypothetical protein EWB00_002947 [Schistosoma japonicum]|uniref:Uncharacterized protein n=1 Tax=Schistosoma japonicum TaxID=6182 RepID=A0A4Z2DWI4_SCHJA|nr:hypothetical protein EWB00_002947 [Schistosoma japonicum]